jgi:hypothetical protein
MIAGVSIFAPPPSFGSTREGKCSPANFSNTSSTFPTAGLCRWNTEDEGGVKAVLAFNRQDIGNVGDSLITCCRSVCARCRR